MALTSWNDILNKPKGVDNIEELALTVEQLSSSVLSISEDVGELALDVSDLSASVLSIGGDVQELDLTVSQLSASNLPYNVSQSTKQVVDNIITQIGDLQYVIYGDVTGASNVSEAFIQVFNSLEDGCYIVQFGYSGAFITVCYKYSSGLYGMMFGVNYYAGNLYIANIANGNLTITTK